MYVCVVECKEKRLSKYLLLKRFFMEGEEEIGKECGRGKWLEGFFFKFDFSFFILNYLDIF